MELVGRPEIKSMTRSCEAQSGIDACVRQYAQSHRRGEDHSSRYPPSTRTKQWDF